MATPAARAIQRANALTRLTSAAETLAGALGVSPPSIPTGHRDPAYLPTLQMDAVSEFLEAAAAAATPDEPAAAPEPEPEPEAKPVARKARAKKADAG